jgi:hypothetical protein
MLPGAVQVADPEYRVEFNKIRPHEAIAWNRPLEVHLGKGRPHHPQLRTRRNPANYLTRDKRGPQ